MCSVRKGVLRNFTKFTGNTCAQTTDARLQNDYINTEQNDFHMSFDFPNLFSLFNNYVYDFYSLDVSIEVIIWSIWKKGSGPDPMGPSPRFKSLLML